MRRFLLALLFCLAPLAAHAVLPDEVLPDPALEARARGITKELRCVVCQSESIDESEADIARDLRLLVRERILAGDTDDEVRAFLVARYGEFVLFRPPMSWRNAPLWLAGPALLVVGGGLAFGSYAAAPERLHPSGRPSPPRKKPGCARSPAADPGFPLPAAGAIVSRPNRRAGWPTKRCSTRSRATSPRSR